uniref:Bromodomain associated domain-containing protein n=1 Tax=Rhizophora mucronata TaxID=61149 RepID=A0A2P2Q661_RHIMU
MEPKLKPYQKLKSRKKHQNQENQCQISANPSEFAFQITKTAVSQICRSVGFKSSQLHAIEALTHVATLYLKALAKTAVLYCNASNRTQSNLFDLVNALHDIDSIRGFVGAPMLHDIENNCLLTSSVLKDLCVFVNSTDEIPFAKPIPRKNPMPLPRYLDSLALNSRDLHIPMWLPGFPDKTTYKKCEENVCDRRREDMILWENSDLGQSCSGISNVMPKETVGSNLAMERKRVRFKIGKVESRVIGVTRLDMGNQVCRGKKTKLCWNKDGNCVGDDMISTKKRR